MSAEQNIQIAQKAYADFVRGDIASLLDAIDENIEWVTPDIGIPPGGRYNGKAEVAHFFQQVSELWDFQAFEPQNYIASGDQVAVQGFYSFTAKTTGRSGKSERVMVWTIRNGKCVHFQEYVDSAALRDALAKTAAA